MILEANDDLPHALDPGRLDRRSGQGYLLESSAMGGWDYNMITTIPKPGYGKAYFSSGGEHVEATVLLEIDHTPGPADISGGAFLVVPAAIDLENVSVLEGA